MATTPVVARPVEIVGTSREHGRLRVLAVLLGTWALANGLTHLLVWLATKKIYYELSPPAEMAAEASIGALNFLLAVLVVKFYFRDSSIRDACGWRWTGYQVLGWAIGGFLAMFGLFSILGMVFHNQVISYSGGGPRPYTGGEIRMLALMLLVFPAAGEEMMFRGLLQSKLTHYFGTAIGVILPALLFGLRHHPSDFYFAGLQHASAAAWANRLLQLYGGALIFGLVRLRTRSTWASWLIHMFLLVTIITAGGMWKYVFS